jgi:Tubulin-tyrosine ligase family
VCMFVFLNLGICFYSDGDDPCVCIKSPLCFSLSLSLSLSLSFSFSHYLVSHILSHSQCTFSAESMWSHLESLCAAVFASLSGRLLAELNYQHAICESQTAAESNAPPFKCFHIVGVDVMLDDAFKPWLIEINQGPSLAADSQLDFAIKSSVIEETLCGLGVLNKADVWQPDTAPAPFKPFRFQTQPSRLAKQALRKLKRPWKISEAIAILHDEKLQHNVDNPVCPSMAATLSSFGRALINTHADYKNAFTKAKVSSQHMLCQDSSSIAPSTSTYVCCRIVTLLQHTALQTASLRLSLLSCANRASDQDVVDAAISATKSLLDDAKILDSTAGVGRLDELIRKLIVRHGSDMQPIPFDVFCGILLDVADWKWPNMSKIECLEQCIIPALEDAICLPETVAGLQ